ncbi:MAG TPA: FecR domain-containing protein [Turneriella sp.]|nr:FecR domain-containing protein [Turneriella sp.]
MQLSRRDKVVTTVVVAIILVLLYFLQCHCRNQGQGRSDAQPVGVVEYKYHQVQRKFSDSMQWQDVDAKSPVYAYDWVMTKSKSDARITLNNGMKVDMDPDAMIEIDENQAGVGMTLHGGSVRADTRGAKNAKLKTADGTEIELNDARAQIASDGKSLAIDVKEGSASVKKEGGDAQRVNAGEIATLEKGNLTKEKVSIRLVKPTDALILDDSSKDVEFVFEKPADAKDCQVLLTGEEGGRTLKATSSPVRARVGEGSYKWRVECKQNEKTITSGTGLFRMRAGAMLEVVYPQPGQTVYANEAQNLALRWKSNTPVQIELADDAAFQNKLRTEKSDNQILAVGTLKPGRYFWRLTPESGAPKVASFSVSEKGELLAETDTQSSKEQPLVKKIETKTELKNESPKTTKKNQALTTVSKTNYTIEPDARVAQVPISWSPVNAAYTYRVRVAPSKDLVQSVNITPVKGKGKATLSLKPGTHYYRVDAFVQGNKKPVAQSPVKQIQVAQKKLPPPPRVKSVEAD